MICHVSSVLLAMRTRRPAVHAVAVGRCAWTRTDVETHAETHRGDGPQRLVLRVAGLFPGLSPGDLATILHVHPSTLTDVIQRVVTQGLLVRADDPHDRRRAILRLTKRGGRVNAARRATVESSVAEALDDVSTQDRQAARRVLERLAQHLRQ